MPASRIVDLLHAHLSRTRVRTVFQELVRVPSPQTEALENEPLLCEFMRVALLPRMAALGMTNARQDAMGNLIAAAGRDRSGRSRSEERRVGKECA